MSLTKSDIKALQSALTPSTKQFSILDVLQKFPDNQKVHQIFREICLHYQSSTLSFNQIIQYLLGQFNRKNQHQPAINNPDTLNQQNIRTLRIEKKNHSEQQFNVVLLSQRINTQQIKQLIMLQSPTTSSHHQQQPSIPQLYAITNTSIYSYNFHTEQFTKQFIIQANNIIQNVYIYGSIVMYITKNKKMKNQQIENKQMFMQVMMNKLKQINYRKNNYHQLSKMEIKKVFITQFTINQTILSIHAIQQQKWLVCTPHSIKFITIDLNSLLQQFHPIITQLHLPSSHSPTTTFHSICFLPHPYLALMTTSSSILILDTNHLKFTNKIYNDINFTTICYNYINQMLVAGDYGGFLMTLHFNSIYGDLQQQGNIYKKNKSHINIKPSTQLSKHINNSSRILPLTKRQLITDPPINKQHKTTFSNTVQNSTRYPLQCILTKDNSIFTYESQFQKIIKIWNIKTLRVYQKINTSIKIKQMKVCAIGLYLISSEKGYLCYYPFQKLSTPIKPLPQTLIQASLSSNILYLQLTTLHKTTIYKLRLSNKPSLTYYTTKNIKNIQKLLKFAFYKKQIYIFSSQLSALQTLGIFGQNKQLITNLNDYYSMIPYQNKQGIILYGNKQICIRCQTIIVKKKPVIYKKLTKGQNIYLNYNQNENLINKQQPSTNTIIFKQYISEVKVFQCYIQITCTNKHNNAIYIIDQSTLSLMLLYPQFDITTTQLIQSHKLCSLIYQNQQNNKKPFYYLLTHHPCQLIWKSQQLQGWTLQSSLIITIHSNQIDLISVYKSITPTLDNSKPIYYLITYRISLPIQQIPQPTPTSQFRRLSHLQVQTILDLTKRSNYQKITKQHLFKSINSPINSQSISISTKSYQIYPPDPSSYPASINNLQSQPITSKILYYNRQQMLLMFSIIITPFLFLYQLTQQPTAQLLSILNLSIPHPPQHNQNLSNCILYWNPEYKKDDETLWQYTKSHALKQSRSKISNSTYSIKKTYPNKWIDQSQNPQIYQQQHIDLPSNPPPKSKSSIKIPQQSSPIRINRLIYKNNIRQQIQKQNEQRQNKIKSLVQKQMMQNSLNTQNSMRKTILQSQIKNLTKIVQIQKQTLFSQWNYTSKNKKKSPLHQPPINPPLPHSYSISLHPHKKQAYQQKALQNIQHSKQLLKKLLPRIQQYKKQNKTKQKQKINHIYDLLKKQIKIIEKNKWKKL